MPRSTANANNGVRHRPAAIARCRYAEHTPVRNVTWGTRSATRGIAIPASILVPLRDQTKVGRFMNFEVPYCGFWARTWRAPRGGVWGERLWRSRRVEIPYLPLQGLQGGGRQHLP